MCDKLANEYQKIRKVDNMHKKYLREYIATSIPLFFILLTYAIVENRTNLPINNVIKIIVFIVTFTLSMILMIRYLIHRKNWNKLRKQSRIIYDKIQHDRFSF
ncbi:MAG: hypothetical protein GPJ54_12340 [Candidatus Heimdallarchaeota archaeon]|nr:hypothetical protein [Candidatus Heimdallarchaeota archaeon]